MFTELPDIGLIGRAQVGKDTAAQQLGIYGYRRLAFADALRSMAAAIDPIVAWGETEDRPIRYAEVLDLYGYEDAKKAPEVRRFLQRLGTDGVRNHLGENAWVDAAMLAASKVRPAPVAWPDVRFPNEADAIRSTGGVLVRILRPNAIDLGANSGHISESALDDYETDFTVVNDGTVSDFADRLHEVVMEVMG